jgi:hypothetical protein
MVNAEDTEQQFSAKEQMCRFANVQICRFDDMMM